jgi:D-alanyl-D-alanine carboxypeptidase
MRIGSITKTYMAALTLRLDDVGVLDIDDPVATYLPGLGIDDTATIRDLLAHTSGIADPDPAEIVALFREDSGQRFEYRDLIAFAQIPTDSDPRSGEFAYANSGYHVLGGVIEAATGTDVAAALRTHILDPAGLTQTHLAGAEPVPTQIVPGNIDLDGDGDGDTLAAVPYLAVETAMWSAGALVSTADDVIRFARALFAGTILSENALAEMTATSTAEHGHGLGIFDVGVDGKTVYGNSGAAPGFHANFAHHPTSGTTVVMFTNCPSCPITGNDTWQLLVDLLTIADTNSA